MKIRRSQYPSDDDVTIITLFFWFDRAGGIDGGGDAVNVTDAARAKSNTCISTCPTYDIVLNKVNTLKCCYF